jgi:hypothetical protein
MELFAENERVAVKIGLQWYDAYIKGRNIYGGVYFYLVELLDGSKFNVQYKDIQKV